jgi:drug/metabolite transporter (DMT)-like permease
VATAALILVTAVWGITFVQVKDAVELYPLLAFLAIRYVIATAALAPIAVRRLGGWGRAGCAAGAGRGPVSARGWGMHPAGPPRTTVTSTGFITGLYVLFTPLLGLALFRTPIPRSLWAGVALALLGLALLSGVPQGSGQGDLLVLISAFVQAFHIVMVERYANRFDVFALTFMQVAAAAVAFGAVSLAFEELTVPRGWTVWSALIVTGLFAVAFAYVVQVWAQRRVSATRIAIVFSLETVFAGLFGYLLAGDRLGALGFAGCAAIYAGIVVAEPAAAATLKALTRQRRKKGVPA